MPKLRVAICGGGIGGLCFAVALSRYSDIEVSVYEAAGQFKEIGAGVMIWERTWNILTSLGLSNQLSEIADGSMDGSLGVGFEFRRSDMASEGFQFCLFETPYGCIRFHRAHFLDVFINNLPSGVAHFGKRLLNYVDQPQNPEILLNFADGTKATCDLLVGCDGVKSIVRKQMFETLALEGQQHLLQYIEPKFSGIFAYRGLIPIERLRKEAGGTNHRTIHRAMMASLFCCSPVLCNSVNCLAVLWTQQARRNLWDRQRIHRKCERYGVPSGTRRERLYRAMGARIHSGRIPGMLFWLGT